MLFKNVLIQDKLNLVSPRKQPGTFSSDSFSKQIKPDVREKLVKSNQNQHTIQLGECDVQSSNSESKKQKQQKRKYPGNLQIMVGLMASKKTPQSTKANAIEQIFSPPSAPKHAWPWPKPKSIRVVPKTRISVQLINDYMNPQLDSNLRKLCGSHIQSGSQSIKPRQVRSEMQQNKIVPVLNNPFRDQQIKQLSRKIKTLQNSPKYKYNQDLPPFCSVDPIKRPLIVVKDYQDQRSKATNLKKEVHTVDYNLNFNSSITKVKDGSQTFYYYKQNPNAAIPRSFEQYRKVVNPFVNHNEQAWKQSIQNIQRKFRHYKF